MMAYTDTYGSSRNPGTIVAVTALHVALGYVLVTGLVATVFPPDVKPPLVGNTMPNDPPAPPPGPRPKDPKPQDNPITVTNPLIPIPGPNPIFTPGPGPIPTGSDDGIGVVTFPTPEPTFSPTAPRFIPKPVRPLGNPARWVSPDDYPTSELRLGHEGITRFRLSVGADGRVTSCAVTGSSGWPRLDAAACAKLAARGKFRPATGEDGEQTAGSYASSVLWDIPDE